MVMTYDVQMEIGHFHSTPRSAPALPCASRPPSAPRPCHARPTHQPSVSPAKQLPPMPDERGAWRGALPGPDRSLSLRERGGSSRTEGFTASSEAFPTRDRPTLTSRQRFHTKFDIQISTLFSRYKYPQFSR